MLLMVLFLSGCSITNQEEYHLLYIEKNDEAMLAHSVSTIHNVRTSNIAQSPSSLFSIRNQFLTLNVKGSLPFFTQCGLTITELKQLYENTHIPKHFGQYLNTKQNTTLNIETKSDFEYSYPIEQLNGVWHSQFHWALTSCDDFTQQLFIAVITTLHELYHIDFFADGSYQGMTLDDNEYRAITLTHCDFWTSGQWHEIPLTQSEGNNAKNKFYLYDQIRSLLGKDSIQPSDIQVVNQWCSDFSSGL